MTRVIFLEEGLEGEEQQEQHNDWELNQQQMDCQSQEVLILWK